MLKRREVACCVRQHANVAGSTLLIELLQSLSVALLYAAPGHFTFCIGHFGPVCDDTILPVFCQHERTHLLIQASLCQMWCHHWRAVMRALLCPRLYRVQ